MCYKVDSSFALIHHLKAKESCTIKEMVEIKYKIEKNIPSVYVDVSRSSILQTISSYPEIFCWEENRIRRKETAQKYFNKNVIEFFNNDLDKSLEREVIKYFEVE